MTMDLKLFLTTFLTLFVAEIGDKTQLACICLAAKTHKPWTVWLGASAALVLVSLLGVLLAQVVTQHVPENIVKKVAAAMFVGIGLLMFADKV
jgi:putative Ca2+/H+ antiporter (TMEM165/GDT1 family)